LIQIASATIMTNALTTAVTIDGPGATNLMSTTSAGDDAETARNKVTAKRAELKQFRASLELARKQERPFAFIDNLQRQVEECEKAVEQLVKVAVAAARTAKSDTRLSTSYFKATSASHRRSRKRKREASSGDEPEVTRPEMTNQERIAILDKKYTEDFQQQNVRACDLEDYRAGKQKECIEYADIIIAEKKRNEKKHLPNPRYFTEIQVDIKPRMRTILFNWLVEVHKKFRLTDVSLWTAFSITDRFLSRVELNRDRLQLIGCCSLWIATKYHEIYPPLSKDFVYISDDAFSRADLLRCEEVMCEHLAFNFTVPTVYTFLCRYIKIATHSIELKRRRDRVKWLTFYSAERVMLCESSLSFEPSVLASGALHSALSMTGRSWTPEIERFTGYSEADLKRICRLTRRTVLRFDDRRHSAVIAKYENPARGSVSMLRRKNT